MKNVINYFYNIDIKDIYQNKEEYYFKYNNDNYTFQEYKRTNEELYELYNLEYYLYSIGIYLHEIILNNTNQILTNYNDKNYILMKIIVNDDDKINVNHVKKISNIIIPNNYKSLLRNNWLNMWSNKIDYIENVIDSNKNKYKEFGSNIDYFIGLTENAIQLLGNVNNDKMYLSHQRININMKVKDLYNHLNIIIDNRCRDICELYKDKLIKEKEIENLNLYIDDLNNYEKYLFFIRFLYITQYFDIFDKTLHDDFNSEEFYNIINSIEKYEEFIKELYVYLNSNNILPEIEWIKKQAYKLV
ncbi:MAG TPA: hypothetical protein PLV83_00025 [Bacilli bacterium]|nr:hypothetical protein [Bacilli bacterium]